MYDCGKCKGRFFGYTFIWQICVRIKRLNKSNIHIWYTSLVFVAYNGKCVLFSNIISLVWVKEYILCEQLSICGRDSPKQYFKKKSIIKIGRYTSKCLVRSAVYTIQFRIRTCTTCDFFTFCLNDTICQFFGTLVKYYSRRWTSLNK